MSTLLPRFLVAVLCTSFVTGTALADTTPTTATSGAAVTSGELRELTATGEPTVFCPPEKTEVRADIKGFVGRVSLKQSFRISVQQNLRVRPDSKIEAQYLFPLPATAAIDSMTVTIGKRRIVAQIKTVGEARRAYDTARQQGQAAALLTEARPNLFVQSLANLEPGAVVGVELTYIEPLRYRDGNFEWVFPLVARPGVVGTSGGNVSIEVNIDGGLQATPQLTEVSNRPVTISGIKCLSHNIKTTTGPAGTAIRLQDGAAALTRDFVLRFQRSGGHIDDTYLTQTDAHGKFLTLILQPPPLARQTAARQARAREMIFMLDRGPAMQGDVLEQARELLTLSVLGLNPNDTFNLVSFEGGGGLCFPRPVPNTAENRDIALRYLDDQYGSDKLKMGPALQAVLAAPADPTRLRVIGLITNGGMGNEYGIINEVQKNGDSARVFALGIGPNVNRYLLDTVTEVGRGEATYVPATDDNREAVQRFYERMQAPLLTDIEIAWGDLPVADVYPRRIPDLFSTQPIMIHARLRDDATAVRGNITLRGVTAAAPYQRMPGLNTAVSESVAQGSQVLPVLWAKSKVHDLMLQDTAGFAADDVKPAIKAAITTIGLDYHIATPYTSFVAVEKLPLEGTGRVASIDIATAMTGNVNHPGVPAMGGTMQSMEMMMTSVGRAVAAPPSKVAPALLQLADRIEKEGKDGNLQDGGLTVKEYRVAVLIRLRDTSDATMQALAGLGFQRSNLSQTAPIVVGTADIRKLRELGALAPVVQILEVPQSNPSAV